MENYRIQQLKRCWTGELVFPKVLLECVLDHDGAATLATTIKAMKEDDADFKKALAAIEALVGIKRRNIMCNTETDLPDGRKVWKNLFEVTAVEEQKYEIPVGTMLVKDDGTIVFEATYNPATGEIDNVIEFDAPNSFYIASTEEYRAHQEEIGRDVTAVEYLTKIGGQGGGAGIAGFVYNASAHKLVITDTDAQIYECTVGVMSKKGYGVAKVDGVTININSTTGALSAMYTGTDVIDIDADAGISLKYDGTTLKKGNDGNLYVASVNPDGDASMVSTDGNVQIGALGTGGNVDIQADTNMSIGAGNEVAISGGDDVSITGSSVTVITGTDKTFTYNGKEVFTEDTATAEGVAYDPADAPKALEDAENVKDALDTIANELWKEGTEGAEQSGEAALLAAIKPAALGSKRGVFVGPDATTVPVTNVISLTTNQTLTWKHTGVTGACYILQVDSNTLSAGGNWKRVAFTTSSAALTVSNVTSETKLLVLCINPMSNVAGRFNYTITTYTEPSLEMRVRSLEDDKQDNLIAGKHMDISATNVIDCTLEDAKDIKYDDTATALGKTDVQTAIEELDARVSAAMANLVNRMAALEDMAYLAKLRIVELQTDNYPVVKGGPSVRYGNGAPSATTIPERSGVPDFIGQIYMDTNGGSYIAKGVNSVSDWIGTAGVKFQNNSSMPESKPDFIGQFMIASDGYMKNVFFASGIGSVSDWILLTNP